jgi:hypothetical protein
VGWHWAGLLTVGLIFVEFFDRDNQCWHGAGLPTVSLIFV